MLFLDGNLADHHTADQLANDAAAVYIHRSCIDIAYTVYTKQDRKLLADSSQSVLSRFDDIRQHTAVGHHIDRRRDFYAFFNYPIRKIIQQLSGNTNHSRRY